MRDTLTTMAAECNESPAEFLAHALNGDAVPFEATTLCRELGADPRYIDELALLSPGCIRAIRQGMLEHAERTLEEKANDRDEIEELRCKINDLVWAIKEGLKDRDTLTLEDKLELINGWDEPA